MGWIDELKPLVTAYFVMPLVSPDFKALGIGAVAASLMIGVSTPFAQAEGGMNPRDYVIPGMLFVYMYFPSYSRAPLQPTQQQAAGEGGGEGAETAAGPNVDEVLAAATCAVGRRLWGAAAAPKVEVLVVLSLDAQTAKFLVPFESICKRHSSERLRFVCASPEADTVKVRSLTDEFDGAMSFSVLAGAEQLLALNVKRRAIFVLRIDAQRGATLAWHGHVASLEAALASYFSAGGDESTSSDDEDEVHGPVPAPGEGEGPSPAGR